MVISSATIRSNGPPGNAPAPFHVACGNVRVPSSDQDREYASLVAANTICSLNALTSVTGSRVSACEPQRVGSPSGLGKPGGTTFARPQSGSPLIGGSPFVQTEKRLDFGDTGCEVVRVLGEAEKA